MRAVIAAAPTCLGLTRLRQRRSQTAMVAVAMSARCRTGCGACRARSRAAIVISGQAELALPVQDAAVPEIGLAVGREQRQRGPEQGSRRRGIGLSPRLLNRLVQNHVAAEIAGDVPRRVFSRGEIAVKETIARLRPGPSEAEPPGEIGMNRRVIRLVILRAARQSVERRRVARQAEPVDDAA